ncbi:MAG: prolyl aminopeptidase [Deltaproteobacteria bacterium]|nr:prolyl aminopeptidase [Deltaproteobacteria bacterium]
MTTLYPPLEPFNTFRLPVSGLHQIHVEEAGNPQGVPVVFFHGGPGGGTDPMHRRYFDPAKYRIVLFDQRGCGKSTPHAELKENTTWDLVNDAEAIRAKLKIDHWHVFGGSWGSTLALSYAVQHPEKVRSLTLRGIFLIRRAEIQFFYQEGTSWIFPDFWEEYLKPIPVAERGDLVTAYYRRLTCGDDDIEAEAARAWSVWEGSTSKLFPDEGLIHRTAGDGFARQLARIECHYFVNNGFFPYDGWLLEQSAKKLQNIPTVIVQGRYDVVCPAKSAWDLKKAMPHAELIIVKDAGHSASETGIVTGLVDATNRFASV